MKYISLSQNENSVEILTDAGKIRLQVWDNRVIHVRYTLQESFSSQPTLMVLDQPHETTPWSLEENDQAIILSTGAIRLAVNKASCAFTWMDGAGDLLVREPIGGGKMLREIDLADRKAYSTKLSLEFSEGEAIYGFGQHEEGLLNYRGQSQLVYHHNLKVAMPVMVSTRGYAFLFDSYSIHALMLFYNRFLLALLHI